MDRSEWHARSRHARWSHERCAGYLRQWLSDCRPFFNHQFQPIVGSVSLDVKDGHARLERGVGKRRSQHSPGWILITADRVSSDGTVIVGTGLNPSRQWEAFRAVLSLPQ